jgi:hypothetical protein
MPIVQHQIRTGSVTTSVTSDAGSGAGNLVSLNANGNITVNAPSNPVDWQRFEHHIVALGAARTVTFGGGYVTSGPSLGPWSLTRGQVLVARSTYIGNRNNSSDQLTPAWALEYVGITDTLTAPNLHASTHATGGTDPITPGNIGAATSGHSHTAAGVGAVPQLTERAVSANATAVSGEFVFVTAGAGTKQVTLPAATVGATVGVKKADTGAGVVLVAAAGTDTWVNGGNASRQLNIQDEQVIVYCYQAGQWTTVDQGFSTYWGDTRYAPQTRSITAGTGLTGGGNLQADRSLAVSFGSSSTTVAAGDHTHAAAYQPLDSDLTTIAGLAATTDNVIQSVGSAWASRTPAQLKSTLALVKGDVGLGSVDNTADSAKPVSTAQQTALDAKLDAIKTSSTKTANYTLVDADHQRLVMFNSASNLTATLPAAAGRTGTRFIIKKIGTGTLTIDPNGTETIDGALTEVISVSNGFRVIESDGTGWQVIGGRIDPVVATLANVGNGGTISINAAQASVYRVSTTGATATLAVPTNSVDADVVNVEVLATAALTLSLNASIVNCSGATFPASVAINKRAFLGLRCISSTWYLLAYSVEP